MSTGPDIHPPLLLIGSLPGDAARAVMAQWGEALGPRLLALPDGETGYRRMWMEFLCCRVFEPNPAIETRSRPPPVDPEDPADWCRPGDDWISLGYERGTWRFRVRPDAGAIDLGELGYAREAVASYRAFEALRAEGRIAPALRFQVSIPLHDSSLRWYMERRRDVERLWRPYSEAVAREVEAMQVAIPAEDLLIQWDACAETLGFDPAGAGHWPWQPEGDRLERFSWSVAELSAAVPEPVMLGLHLCYGSFVEQHLVEPADLETCVALANAAVRGAGRRLDYVHMPVPKNRADDAFFAPLRHLEAGGTNLYLGLVHGDPLEANLARVAAAKRHAGRFGVAAECGFGRAPQEKMPALIARHREVADALPRCP